jgi:hypothetical protein
MARIVLRENRTVMEMQAQEVLLDLQGVRRLAENSHRPDSSNCSQDDAERQELLWDGTVEGYVTHIENKCRSKTDQHLKASAFRRKAFHAVGIPSVILPLVAAVMQCDPGEYAWVVTTIIVVSGSCSAVNAFMDFGKNAQAHLEYAARFEELSSEIDSMLCRPKSGRVAADVFLERCQNKIAALTLGAPPL